MGLLLRSYTWSIYEAFVPQQMENTFIEDSIIYIERLYIQILLKQFGTGSAKTFFDKSQSSISDKKVKNGNSLILETVNRVVWRSRHEVPCEFRTMH